MSQVGLTGQGKSMARSGAAAHLNPQQRTKSAPFRGGGDKSTEDVTMLATEHSFLTDVADVRQMEQGLLQLLDDFHQGKLQAFGMDCTFEKMDNVRERQERLARVHFDLDSHLEVKGPAESMEAKEAANKHLDKLMDNLQELCTSIQSLQKDHPPSQGPPS